MIVETFGLKVVNSVPREGDRYIDWLQRKRQYYDNLGKKYRQGETDKKDLGCYVSTYSPLNDEFIEWTCTIDLDHEVVSQRAPHRASQKPGVILAVEWCAVDSFPMFPAPFTSPRRRLPRLYRLLIPTPTAHMRSTHRMDIGIAGRSRRLQLTRVSWTRTAPPTLSVQDIHPILEISACLGDVDAVREEMHQILVGTLMGIETVGPSLRELEKIKSRSQYRPMGFYDHFANILSTVPIESSWKLAP